MNLAKLRKGIAIIESTAIIVVVGFVFVFGTFFLISYSDRSRHVVAEDDLKAIEFAVSMSYSDTRNKWEPHVGVASTGTENMFKDLFTGDYGKATDIINSKLTKKLDSLKDPFGQPYDISIVNENGDMVLYILCRQGESAISVPSQARVNKYMSDSPPMFRSVELPY